MRGPLLWSIIAVAVAAGRAHADRPAQVGLGVELGYTATPIAPMVGGAVTIDAGGAVDGPFWWFATASFGPGELTGDRGRGNTFALRTGPRLERCWGGRCLSAAADVGWNHTGWSSPDRTMITRVDSLTASVHAHASTALTPNRRVLIEIHGGPTWLRPLASSGDPMWTEAGAGDLGFGFGVAMVVRN